MKISKNKIELWLEPNKLYENGKGWNNQLTQSHEKFKEFEKLYKNDRWWREMKPRMKNKNAKEIELDRRLLEHVGSIFSVNGEWSKPNLEKIKKTYFNGGKT